jgi:hypothetical protein
MAVRLDGMAQSHERSLRRRFKAAGVVFRLLRPLR